MCPALPPQGLHVQPGILHQWLLSAQCCHLLLRPVPQQLPGLQIARTEPCGVAHLPPTSTSVYNRKPDCRETWDRVGCSLALDTAEVGVSAADGHDPAHGLCVAGTSKSEPSPLGFLYEQPRSWWTTLWSARPGSSGMPSGSAPPFTSASASQAPFPLP